MQTFAALLALFALAHSALAGVYTTNPVATTNQQGGHTITVSWADDGNTPTVGSIGPCSIDIYTGSRDQQTRLQNLAASVDVSKTSQIVATVDPHIGPSGAYYFIRFASLSLKDAAQPQYPYQAYSARFTLNGMDGQFNQTVLAQLNAANVPVSSASSTGAARSSGPSSAAASASKSAGAAAAAQSSSAALPQAATNGLFALVVGVAGYIAL